MSKDEALKLAFAFIERVNRDGWVLADFEPEMYATLDAIKKALAQDQVRELKQQVLMLETSLANQIAQSILRDELEAGRY